MRERRQQELSIIAPEFGELEISAALDWFIVNRLALTSGWSMEVTPVLILIPSGYPTTPPDNFYTDPNLRLKNGQQPGSTSGAVQLGKQWLQFSYHVEDWQPHGDFHRGHNLLSFLYGVRRRLSEVD